MERVNETLSPILYLPHGGGPLPLLGDKNHEGLITFLKGISANIKKPSAILVVSAHWEESQATITSNDQPELIYDYSGFPAAAYEIQYAAAGDPKLAQKISQSIENDNIQVRLNPYRGFDHGMYVPLKLMYPQADIPCLELSLLKSLDPSEHIALGKSLASLRQQNILIIGSGLSFHNLGLFFRPQPDSLQKSILFDRWLVDICTNANLTSLEKEQQLIHWTDAPHARHCHPREEHLLPLHVCFGAASVSTPNAKVIFNQDFLGARTTALQW